MSAPQFDRGPGGWREALLFCVLFLFIVAGVAALFALAIWLGPGTVTVAK